MTRSSVDIKKTLAWGAIAEMAVPVLLMIAALLICLILSLVFR